MAIHQMVIINHVLAHYLESFSIELFGNRTQVVPMTFLFDLTLTISSHQNSMLGLQKVGQGPPSMAGQSPEQVFLNSFLQIVLDFGTLSFRTRDFRQFRTPPDGQRPKVRVQHLKKQNY